MDSDYERRYSSSSSGTGSLLPSIHREPTVELRSDVENDDEKIRSMFEGAENIIPDFNVRNNKITFILSEKSKVGMMSSASRRSSSSVNAKSKTSPEDMEGAPRMHQHQNFHRQLAAFEKLTQHAYSKFSLDKLYEMLHQVSTGIPYTKGAKIITDRNEATHVTSIVQLRQMVESLKDTKRKGIHKEEADHVTKYFETFFQDLQYLRNLKSYFDERLYCCLYEYFYDPTDVELSVNLTKLYKESALEEADSGRGSGDDTPSRLSGIDRKGFGTANLSRFTDKQRLMYAVRELHGTNRRWDSVLSENEIPDKIFESDSLEEIKNYPGHKKFVKVFRLVPDIFAKCHKSAEIAKIWWTQSSKIYAPEEGAKPIEVKLAAVSKRIAKLSEDVVMCEQQRLVYHNDLKDLQQRESRVDILNNDRDNVTAKHSKAKEYYETIIRNRGDLKEKLNNTIQGTVRYSELSLHLRNLELEMVEKYHELRLLEYKHDILTKDYHVELEVRPDFMRFTDHITNKIKDLEGDIDSKTQERMHNEKALELLRVNTDRIQKARSRRERELESARDSEVPSEPEEPNGFFITARAAEEISRPESGAIKESSRPDSRPESSIMPESEARDTDENLTDDESETPVPKQRKKKPRPTKMLNHSAPLGQPDYL